MTEITTVSNNNATISENNLTIAENTLKVYEAGQKSMVDESKIIKATATADNVLALDDVSEIPHEVSVSVKKKNLMLSPFGAVNVENGKTYTISIALKPNISYGSTYSLAWYDVDGNWRNHELATSNGVCISSHTFIAGENGYHDYYIDSSGFTEDMFEYVQLEEGDKATPYSPFVGKNLLDIDSMLNDVLTKNGDEYVFARTTNISNDWYGRASKYVKVFIPANTPFTLSVESANYNGELGVALRLQVKFDDNTTATNMNITNDDPVCTKTYTKNIKEICFYIHHEEPMETVTIFTKPQLEIGSVATEYEPFINPMVGSRNLFYVNATRKVNSNGIECDLTEGKSSFIFNGTTTKDASFNISVFTLKAGTYTVSVFGTNTITGDMDRIFLRYTDTSGTATTVNNIMAGVPKTFTLSSDSSVRIDSVIASNSTYSNKEICVQIEKGTAATPYVPYASVISQVKLRVSGKNLFDIATAPDLYHYGYTWEKTDTGFIVTSTTEGDDCWIRHGLTFGRYEDLVGKTFTISLNYHTTANVEKPLLMIVNCDSQSGTIGNSLAQGIKDIRDTILTFTVPKGLPYEYMGVFFYLTGGGSIKVGDTFEYSNIQIEEGTAATKYEPYIEPITLSLDDEGKATTKSMSPNMIFTSNTGDVLITSKYHKSYGMQTEYDKFWDGFQNYGARSMYSSAFGFEWNDNIFKPKYDIVPTGDNGADNMFFQTKIVDLAACLEKANIKFDTSQATRLNSVFDRSTSLEIVPPLNAVNATRMVMTYYNSNKIKKIVIKNISRSCTFDRAFNYLSALETLELNNCIIGQNGFDVQWSTKLSRNSIVSIIDALSYGTNGLTVTLSEVAVANAFETSAGAGDGHGSQEWYDLIATKNNWTISLV